MLISSHCILENKFKKHCFNNIKRQCGMKEIYSWNVHEKSLLTNKNCEYLFDIKKNSVRKRLCWRYFPGKPWLQPYRIKIEPVTVGADATVYVWFLDQIYAVQTALPPLQPWLAIGFSAAITDYFWDSVQISRTLKQAGTLKMPLWKLQIC